MLIFSRRSIQEISLEFWRSICKRQEQDSKKEEDKSSSIMNPQTPPRKTEPKFFNILKFQL